MNVEIAICTWNRARLLNETLYSISQIVLPDEVALRVIIVDNNSTDETRSVVEKSDCPFKLDLISEPKQGHAYARNTAIQNACGDLLIWTDDDVRVDSRWVEAYVMSAQTNPDVDFFGGPITPVFSPHRPNWISDNWDKLSGCFAERQLGNEPIEFSKDVLPYGANFAIRTNVQKSFFFNESTGRKRNRVTGDDEIEMLTRAVSAGHRGLWVPSASIHHVITPERQTIKFIQNYFIGQGISLVAKNENWHNDIARLKRESKWELGCFRIKRAFVGSDAWVSHLIRGSLAKGQYLALEEHP